MSAIVEMIEPSLKRIILDSSIHPKVDRHLNSSVLGISHPIFTIDQKQPESFKKFSNKTGSFKSEQLFPLAQMHYEVVAKAESLQRQVDTLQAQADLNAQKTGEAVIRAEIAEAKVEGLSSENEVLKEDLEKTQERLDGTFQNEQRLLKIIDDLRGTTARISGKVDSSWAVLGLDPKTAFAGLSAQQRQVVLDGAYRARSKISHPDNGGNEEKMKIINAAYSSLKQSI